MASIKTMKTEREELAAEFEALLSYLESIPEKIADQLEYEAIQLFSLRAEIEATAKRFREDT